MADEQHYPFFFFFPNLDCWLAQFDSPALAVLAILCDDGTRGDALAADMVTRHHRYLSGNHELTDTLVKLMLCLQSGRVYESAGCGGGGGVTG